MTEIDVSDLIGPLEGHIVYHGVPSMERVSDFPDDSEIELVILAIIDRMPQGEEKVVLMTPKARLRCTRSAVNRRVVLALARRDGV